jgi:hypothetical protein
MLLRTGALLMRTMILPAACAVIFTSISQGASFDRSPVPNLRPLMVSAIDSPTGEAHGVLAGDIADAITKKFQGTTPIYIDITTEKRYTQISCSRLRVTFWQDGVLLPGTPNRRKQTIEFGINYCRDGSAPKSLS